MHFGKSFVVLVAGSLVAMNPISGSASTVPLSTYYPNASRYQAHYYLEGVNVANPQAPSRSVLWFQTQRDGSFEQFNSAPYDTCHWDQLSWKTGTLTYSKTHDQCGTNNNEISYSPGVKFMPSTLSGRSWFASGSSAVAYSDHGKLACSGTDTWSSQWMGPVALTPTETAQWIQNNQSTLWRSGSAPSGCAAGYRTQWQENFYLVANLPVQGSTTGDYALAREVGGNVATFSATGNWDYDVWYGSWNRSP